MKNVTTKFSPTANNPLYFISGNTKYKNVKLVPVSDAGYQEYRIIQITLSKSKRPADHIPNPPTPLSQASRCVEFIVRKWHGSSINRIIQYDVLYQGFYHRHYKECDIIRFESDGSLTIGEIKSSNKPSACKAASQLQHSCEILSTIYPLVNPIAITVNMSSVKPTSRVNNPEITEHQSESGFFFNGTSLSLGDITEFARNNNALNVDFDILVEANIEALACVQKRTEKQQMSQFSYSQQEIPSKKVSVFGMVLQKALSQRNEVFRPI